MDCAGPDWRLGTDDRPLSVYMVFPYMDHDLAGLLENERVKLQPSHIKLYMKQLLEGTAYMHQACSLFTILILQRGSPTFRTISFIET